jgi:hypothetical protein
MPDLDALAAHLHGVLAGRAAGALYVWSKPLFAPHDQVLEVESVSAEDQGRALAFRFRSGPSTLPLEGALRLTDPEDVVLDEHGLRIRSAARVEWGALSAERLGPAWVRLTESGAERTVETARRAAFQLDPALDSPSWLEQHGG